jgi:putative hemolysin
MNRVPKEELNPREAVRMLPPMIKGYLRAGCYIGDGAVIDYQFGTTDVLILFPVSQISDRYLSKFGAKYNTPTGRR